ncbi:MAG: uncharacterized membrane protein YgdD (TMEM256/DUF423 family) [Mariniblastus sp.]|jgi:uncharacterized membrane protein YgdD (TMEM256/DUF423 family)
MTRYCIFLGGLFAALAVALGAYHAHGLEKILGDKFAFDPELFSKRMGNWGTAASYQMYHSIGLILVGLISMFRTSKWLSVAGVCFLVGIVLFSGLLYVLAWTDTRILGAIVPIGGVAMIIGWIALALGGCCLTPTATVTLKPSK